MKTLFFSLLMIFYHNAFTQNDSTRIFTDANKNKGLNTEALPDTVILEGIDAEFVLSKYIEAIGGKENLSRVEDRVTRMTGKVQGFDVRMTIYQKKPNLLRQQIDASGLDQIIIFNGEKGIIKMGEETQVIEGEALQKISYEANMDLMLNPITSGVILELSGTEMIGDTRAYKVINRSGDYKWTTYYSIENSLKILEQKDVSTPSGMFNQEVYFSDYKEIEGIMYPFRIEQKLGSQELDFTVTSIKINQDLEDKLFSVDQ